MWQHYATVLVLWNVFESLLEISIMREAKLAPLQAVIICSGLPFERKASIARSLLALRDATNAIRLINRITQEVSRNLLIHAQIRAGENTITFRKIETDQRLKVKEKTFNVETLEAHYRAFSKLMDELMADLGIYDDAIVSYGRTTNSLLSKSATSPNEPSSKRAE